MVWTWQHPAAAENVPAAGAPSNCGHVNKNWLPLFCCTWKLICFILIYQFGVEYNRLRHTRTLLQLLHNRGVHVKLLPGVPYMEAWSHVNLIETRDFVHLYYNCLNYACNRKHNVVQWILIYIWAPLLQAPKKVSE